MRVMRRALMLLLCCTLVMQGTVQAWAAGATRCPHEVGDASMTMAGMAGAPTTADADDSMASEDEDCCNDLAAQLRTGKLCKALFDGQLSTPALFAAPAIAPAAPACGEVPSWVERPSPPALGAAIWRPPAAR
jgi:hypothetical protein